MKKIFLPLLAAWLLATTLIAVAGCANTPVSTSGTTDSTSSQTTDSTSTPPTTTTLTPETTSQPIDLVPEPPKGTNIQVTYEVNQSYAGFIVGDTAQTVKYGITSTSAVAVTANLGYKFVGWSDGVTTKARRGDCPKSSTTYTAIFEYDVKELPIISLFTDSGDDVTDKDNYVPGRISVSNAPEGFNFEDMAMEIRGRGNNTWGSTFSGDPMRNKRPYRVKLSEKMNLLGQGNGKAKTWVLIANHCDQSLLRNQTVMNFARSLTGIPWEPSASSVEVFLNGQYIGVYMLTEQVQINKNRIDLSEEVESGEKIDFLLHMSNYAFDDEENTSFDYDGKPYEIVSDLSSNPSLAASQIDYIRSRIGACWDAVKNGDKETVLSLIDINSVIDTNIVHELFKNLDTAHDNFYMFSTVDGKLCFGPVWDFDQCAGNANDGVEDYRGIRGSNTNDWYRYLHEQDWYREMFRARWDALYSEITEIPNTIRTTAEAGYRSYCRNFEKWQILAHLDEEDNLVLGYQINRETEVIRQMTSYKEHYMYFATWMENRASWLNSYYHSPQFLKEDVKLNLSGRGTVASPYLINTAADFYNFTLVMGSAETFKGVYFKQTADIDMTTLPFYMGIGVPYVFAGYYDGGGHSINAEITGGTDQSFFPYVKGTVINLVTTGSISNSGATGGIARSVRTGGRIINCGSTVTLVSSGNAGGIVPSNESGGGSVIGCWFAGFITAGDFGPINVYFDGRTTDIFEYNYYISSFCAEDRQESAKIGTETACSEKQLETLHTTLNNNLAAVADKAKLDVNALCRWTVQNKCPAPVAMN